MMTPICQGNVFRIRGLVMSGKLEGVYEFWD